MCRYEDRRIDLKQFESSPFFLCVSVVNFKAWFLWLELTMRFNPMHDKSNTKCCVLEIY